MKVLVVGIHQTGQLAWLCARGFAALRVDTIPLDTSTHPLERYRSSYFPPLALVARTFQQRWANHRLRQLAAATMPDVIFMLKCEEISRTTLAWIRRRLPRVWIANWNPDSPLNPLNTTSRLLDCIPAFDQYFIWGRFLIEPLKKLGASSTAYLPFAHDPDLHRPHHLSRAEIEQWGNNLSFIGTWEKSRDATLSVLADLDLGIWGNHWGQLPPDSPLRRRWRGEAHGEKLAKVNSASCVALNFVRTQNGPAHNMRTFEAPACGIMMLATRTQEQEEFLGEDIGAAFFNSNAELRDKALYYLDHPELRRKIAAEGHRRLGAGHTYADRMTTVLKAFELKTQMAAR